MKAIVNGRILFDGQIIENKALLFEDKIIGIVDIQEMSQDVEIIDAKGHYVAPGFIDIHIHGYDTKDTMDGTEEAIRTIAKGIAQNGVTSFLPTTMTMSKEEIITALEVCRTVKAQGSEGSQVLGVHMEGPYINEAFKGAQNGKYIQEPNADAVQFVKDYQDIVKLITIAPEIEGANEFIKEISNNTGIALSMGHTKADFNQAMEGIEAGITHTTHLFNAMTPLHHRNPGVVGAALASEKVSCEMICDTIHVNKGLYPLVMKAKAPDKFVLVTDCMCAGGCKDGEYALGGQAVFVTEGSARLQDGTLAGSVLRLNEALRNVIEHTEYGVEKAIEFATINPAKTIKVDAFKGTLDTGKDADIIFFDDAVNIKYVINRGKTIHENN
ncbi:MAG: N-acetylglucosamine-6-phosphate deacetylase [Niameybacter sp.]|uniref:N-acetylglucosamine-6-phosphate deacetylase n=1 Tax=Niameybacter sp. TaxID=2033640 RepID=UPI002FCBA85E